eukprot:CAMPEP_0119009046 /NCGR_PEP_ID=MMETSP1176-20130426/4104_1 /TAXON_ID=265551 /ORGANISM="Synedropsis recta cf, Strain CCMP1620" /LENGTH=705 /DNA_ID=CAMNT_0006961489 /DNA_START=762 /DNA_END=2879 /DNA_ORIENTATION=+
MHSHNHAIDLRDQYRGPDLQLFYRDLRDPQKKKRKIMVKTWSTIQDVKHIIYTKTQVPPQAQRLFYGPLVALPNHRTLHDAGIYKHGETLLLDIPQEKHREGAFAEADLRIANSMSELTPRPLRHIIQQCRRGLALGYKPVLVLDGSGGTYFLHDARKIPAAIFKPADEEPYAENNPRGYVGAGGMLRDGIAPGQACLREVAAYMLDHGNFCNVPATTLVEARHAAFHVNGTRLNVSQGGASIGSHSLTPHKNTGSSRRGATKVGSLQVFIKAECTMDDLSPSKIHKDEIHKIALLDMRLMNADRNSANLLCRRRPQDGSIELVPIDHGFCLRSVCDVSWMDWCWLDWPQMKEPISKEIKNYILKIDIDADCQLLKETLNIQGQALDYFRASNKLLKEGVKSGLSLYEIAILCCRNDDLGEVPSKLEMLTEIATELATSAVQNGRWHHSAASRAIAEQLSPEAAAWSTATKAPTPRFFKSASSADMTSFHRTISEEIPGMAQSSVSDASSDVGDAVTDREECDEWAAAIIADVSLDTKFMEVQSPEFEEESVDISSVLSSSPRGFWMTRPGDDQDSDDDTVNWSPVNSPKSNKDLAEVDDLPMAPRVSFAGSLGGAFMLPAPANMTSPPSPILNMRRTSSAGLSKSQSFAAFHSMSTMSSTTSSSLHTSAPEDDSTTWKSYFSKFVDLVIARETAAAANQLVAAY